MGRIRSIKPEFPKSQSIGRLSRDARLCFVMTWTEADDAGRLRGNPRMLASLLFPYDTDAPKLIEAWLRELEEEGCIQRYVDGKDEYIAISNWLDHQKIDHPKDSKLPEPPSREIANDREASRMSAPDPRTIGPLDHRTVGAAEPLATKEVKHESNRRGHRIPDDWQPSPHDWEHARSYGRDDEWITFETESFIDYFRAADGPNASKRDWSAAHRNWLRRAHRDNRSRSAVAGNRAEPAGEHLRAARTAADLYRRSKAANAGVAEAGAGGPVGDEDHGVHGAFLRPEDGGVGALGGVVGLVPHGGGLPAVGGGIRYRPVVIEGTAQADAESDPGANTLRRAQS